jgi:hypothetical protein
VFLRQTTLSALVIPTRSSRLASLFVLDAGPAAAGVGIMRACLELQKLEKLESRMDKIAGRLANDGTEPDRTGPA